MPRISRLRLLERRLGELEEHPGCRSRRGAAPGRNNPHRCPRARISRCMVAGACCSTRNSSRAREVSSEALRQGRARRVPEERPPDGGSACSGRPRVPAILRCARAALVRLGRSLRKAGRIQEALDCLFRTGRPGFDACFGTSCGTGGPRGTMQRTRSVRAARRVAARGGGTPARSRERPMAPHAQRLRVPRGRSAPVARRRRNAAATVRGMALSGVVESLVGPVAGPPGGLQRTAGPTWLHSQPVLAWRGGQRRTASPASGAGRAI